MNIAHNHHLQDEGTSFSAISWVRGVAASVLMGVALALAAPAHAGDRDQQRAEQRYENAQRDRAQQREDVRQFDPRAFESRAEAQRRQLQAQQDQSARHAEANRRSSGRLTPDEKRDLRRQINEAGMDIYPNTPRR